MSELREHETVFDLFRCAALCVIDYERRAFGFDKRARGSLDIAEIGEIFEDAFHWCPLGEQVGDPDTGRGYLFTTADEPGMSSSNSTRSG